MVLGEGDQAPQEALDFIDQSVKRWHNRLTLKNLRLAERYLERELRIAVLLKHVGWGGEEFGALFQRVPLSWPQAYGNRWARNAFDIRKEAYDVETERSTGVPMVKSSRCLFTMSR
jgi:hypothetical protein